MNKLRILILLSIVCVQNCLAQEDFRKSFSEFAKSSRSQYTDFRSRANIDFAKALQEHWDAFKVFDASVRVPLRPASDTLMQACPMENRQLDISDVPVKCKTDRTEPLPTEGVELFSRSKAQTDSVRKYVFTYYGDTVNCYAPACYGQLRIWGRSEKAVSQFWKQLSQLDAGTVVSYLRTVSKELNLNDWAVFEFTSALASTIYPDNRNDERTVFTVFFLNQLGLNCKLARTETSLIPIFSANQEVYGRKYVLIGGEKYYLADAAATATHINTYSFDMAGAEAKIDLNVASMPRIGKNRHFVRDLSSSVLGRSFSLPINRSLIGFYDDYPQLDVFYYAFAEPDTDFSEALARTVGLGLRHKSALESVNALLSFVQNDFNYKKDTEQFGKEKPFFCEENFYYPYNDCEDRAVLFSFLVRKVLGYDCMLLEYSDHVNCAVNMGCESDGYFIRRGDKKYYICDPTCFGARVGMSGKSYRVKPKNIWLL